MESRRLHSRCQPPSRKTAVLSVYGSLPDSGLVLHMVTYGSRILFQCTSNLWLVLFGVYGAGSDDIGLRLGAECC